MRSSVNVKVSSVTVVCILYIIISASFMRYVLNFLRSNLGNSRLEIVIWIFFGLAALVLFYFIWKNVIRGENFIRFLLVLIVIAGVVYHASTMGIIEERIHLVQFGILGFLLTKDNFSKDIMWTVIIAVAGCLFVAALDEIFQYYLPTRVGDIKIGRAHV